MGNMVVLRGRGYQGFQVLISWKAALGFCGLSPGANTPGTSINGRASRVHDGLGRRLASSLRSERLLTSRRMSLLPARTPSLASAEVGYG